MKNLSTIDQINILILKKAVISTKAHSEQVKLSINKEKINNLIKRYAKNIIV